MSTSTAPTLYNLSADDVRERFGLQKLESVYALVRQGLLHPINVGTGGKRPLWRFSEADLAAFIERRTAAPAPKPVRVRTSRPKATSYF